MSKQIQVSSQIFRDSSEVGVRSVVLRKDDALQAHREKIAKVILDDMYQFVGLLDTEGTLLEVNRAALEGAGIRLEDIQGKPFWQARWWQVSPETAQRQKEVCGLAAHGEFVRYDVEIFGSHGGDETIIIDYSLFPVKDNAGRIVFLLAEGRNITEKKKADAEIARKSRELEQLLQRVQELDEIKSQFFANVSHELRTPLALIGGPAEKILREGDYLRGTHRRDIEVIRRNASTLLKHVNDLLDISKLDADKMNLNYAAVDLAQLLRIVSGHFDALAADRGLRYVLDLPPALAVEVDPDKIERIALNLLSNAFKFTPAGGRIKLALLPLHDQARALIQVQDSGPGVRSEDRSAIFERFRQADGSASRQFGGTGLGLSIARDFARLHGGSISVTDAPGGGALFQVEIPTLAPEGRHVRPHLPELEQEEGIGAIVAGTIDELRTTPPEAAPSRQRAEPDRPTVLVVEDNLELNRFIVENLESDYNIITAFDGESGLQQALQARPDLIVTDIMMPKMSGDQMIHRLRQDRSLDTVPVVVLSAKADDALRLRLLEKGAQDYVVKPFSAPELRARVRNLASLKRAQEQLESANLRLQETARGQASALRHSEARFRLLVESIEDYAIIMLDTAGKVLTWNRGAEHLTGYDEADAVGEHFSFLYPARAFDANRPERELEVAAATGRYEEQTIHVRKDGVALNVQVTLSPMEDEQGSVIGFAKIIRDVTRQLAADAAIKESEAKFRTIADAMPQMVWSTLPDGYHDYYNQQWYDFIGMPEGSTDGAGWNTMFHPDDRERAWERWRLSLATGADYEIEYRLRHRSGEYRWTLGRALPVYSETGAIVRWMGTCTDIHDQKLANEALQAANRRKDEFLAMLAHELRNPLAPISAAAELLRLAAANEKLVRQASGVIIRQVNHVSELVNDLLDVSRVTRGLITLEKKVIDVKSVLSGAIEQARPLIEQRQHELTMRMGADNALVFGDRTRLVQVISNILANAAKYTDAGGEIVLDLDVRGDEVAIRVKDNGSGIDASLLPHIFELFTQGARTPDRSQGGLGLGLALVKGVVQLHEGRVEAYSAGLGKGSTFTVVLPVMAGHSKGEADIEATMPLPVGGATLQIMVVDDNRDAGQTLGTLLEALGHQATVKEDARSALEEAAVRPPQVFILDIGLPDIDGYELARRLRSLPGMEQALFIALTGYGQAHDRFLASEAGFDHHFVKPIDVQQLSAILAPRT